MISKQTEGAGRLGAEVKETSAPAQVPDGATTYEDAVTDLPRSETAAAPFQGAVSPRDTRFKPGNTSAVKHGLYAKRPEVVLPAELQEALEAFEAGVVADLGERAS